MSIVQSLTWAKTPKSKLQLAVVHSSSASAWLAALWLGVAFFDCSWPRHMQPVGQVSACKLWTAVGLPNQYQGTSEIPKSQRHGEKHLKFQVPEILKSVGQTLHCHSLETRNASWRKGVHPNVRPPILREVNAPQVNSHCYEKWMNMVQENIVDPPITIWWF